MKSLLEIAGAGVFGPDGRLAQKYLAGSQRVVRRMKSDPGASRRDSVRCRRRGIQFATCPLPRRPRDSVRESPRVPPAWEHNGACSAGRPEFLRERGNRGPPRSRVWSDRRDGNRKFARTAPEKMRFTTESSRRFSSIATEAVWGFRGTSISFSLTHYFNAVTSRRDGVHICRMSWYPRAEEPLMLWISETFHMMRFPRLPRTLRAISLILILNAAADLRGGPCTTTEYRVHSGGRSRIRRSWLLRTDPYPHSEHRSTGFARRSLHAILRGGYGLHAVALCADDRAARWTLLDAGQRR